MLIPSDCVVAQEVRAVVSAGDFRNGIAPLGIASAFGISLSTVTASAAKLPLPTDISGNGLGWCDITTDPKMLDCSAVRLFFVSPNQVNFAVPSIATGSASHQFAVRPSLNGAWSGSPFIIAVQNFAPRIFTVGYDCLADTRFLHANVNCGLTLNKTDEAFQSDRGAVTDQNGIVLTSAHRAKLGPEIWDRPWAIALPDLRRHESGHLLQARRTAFDNPRPDPIFFNEFASCVFCSRLPPSCMKVRPGVGPEVLNGV